MMCSVVVDDDDGRSLICDPRSQQRSRVTLARRRQRNDPGLTANELKLPAETVLQGRKI